MIQFYLKYFTIFAVSLHPHLPFGHIFLTYNQIISGIIFLLKLKFIVKLNHMNTIYTYLLQDDKSIYLVKCKIEEHHSSIQVKV